MDKHNYVHNYTCIQWRCSSGSTDAVHYSSTFHIYIPKSYIPTQLYHADTYTPFHAYTYTPFPAHTQPYHQLIYRASVLLATTTWPPPTERNTIITITQSAVKPHQHIHSRTPHTPTQPYPAYTYTAIPRIHLHSRTLPVPTQPDTTYIYKAIPCLHQQSHIMPTPTQLNPAYIYTAIPSLHLHSRTLPTPTHHRVQLFPRRHIPVERVRF